MKSGLTIGMRNSIYLPHLHFQDQFHDFSEFSTYEEGLDRSDILRQEEAQIVIAENISDDDLEDSYD